MPKFSSKDAKKVKNFEIDTYTKGFTASSLVDGILTQEYFQFKEIQKIIHYPDRCVEIVSNNGTRRVFYNDTLGKSQELYDGLNNTMVSWMNSNLN